LSSQNTTILGVEHQDVYTSKLSSDTQSELYYSIDEGIVLLKLDDENFLTF